MTNEEAITYWEQLRKTFCESRDHTTNELAKEHLQTSIDAIDVALKAIIGHGSKSLTLEHLRDMERINRFEKIPLTIEQVYTFSIRLCDNEVDRDYERFETEGLERLGELFLGKSGIFDYQWSARGQTARIYRTEVVSEPGRITAAGDGYCYLKGWAYLLRTEANGELIAEIEGGIKKEVSVGCSVAESVCSVCGAPAGTCHHVKGEVYDRKLCFTELRRPMEAYEWAFVEAPTQRNQAHIDREAWEPCAECEKKSCDNCRYSEYFSYLEPCKSCENASEWKPVQNFCGDCGRPLTDEAWAVLEKRLRG